MGEPKCLYREKLPSLTLDGGRYASQSKFSAFLEEMEIIWCPFKRVFFKDNFHLTTYFLLFSLQYKFYRLPRIPLVCGPSDLTAAMSADKNKTPFSAGN